MKGYGEAELLAWLRAALADGMSLAHESATHIEDGNFSIEVVATTGEPRYEALDQGVGRSIPWDLLISRVSADWPTGKVFVELPLRRPGDPAVPLRSVATIVCGEEVFATAVVEAGSAGLRDALGAHDPSSLYVVAVVVPPVRKSPNSPTSPSCPVAALSQGAVSLGAVIVSAFDGEGFLYASRQTPD